MIPTPSVLPGGGTATGFIEIQIQSPTDTTTVVWTTDESDPSCGSQAGLVKSATLTLVAEDNLGTAYEIKARSCTDSGSSEVVTQLYQIEPGPLVVVSISLEGDVSAAELAGDARQSLLEAIAKILDVEQERITGVKISDARRRLLAVNADIGIVADSPAAADELSAKAKEADFSAAAAGIPGARVGDITVSGECMYVCHVYVYDVYLGLQVCTNA